MPCTCQAHIDICLDGGLLEDSFVYCWLAYDGACTGGEGKGQGLEWLRALGVAHAYQHMLVL